MNIHEHQAKQILKDTNDDQESELGKFIIETTAFIDAQSKGENLHNFHQSF